MPRSESKTSKSKTLASVPAPTPVPTQIHHVEVEGPGFWRSMKQGFGFGIGSTIGRGLFESKPANGSGAAKDTTQSTNPPYKAAPATGDYVACMAVKENTWEACKYFDQSPCLAPREYIQCMREAKYEYAACKHYLN